MVIKHSWEMPHIDGGLDGNRTKWRISNKPWFDYQRVILIKAFPWISGVFLARDVGNDWHLDPFVAPCLPAESGVCSLPHGRLREIPTFVSLV